MGFLHWGCSNCRGCTTINKGMAHRPSLGIRSKHREEYCEVCRGKKKRIVIPLILKCLRKVISWRISDLDH